MSALKAATCCSTRTLGAIDGPPPAHCHTIPKHDSQLAYGGVATHCCLPACPCVLCWPFHPQVVFTPHLYPPSITMATFLGTTLWEQCRTSFGYLQTDGEPPDCFSKQGFSRGSNHLGLFGHVLSAYPSSFYSPYLHMYVHKAGVTAVQFHSAATEYSCNLACHRLQWQALPHCYWRGRFCL